MALVTSVAQQDKVELYDIPDADLQKYKVSGDKAASMFPEKEKPTGVSSNEGAMGVTSIENAEGLSSEDVQAYHRVCVCRQLYCNAYTCWWHYYYCWC